MFEKNFLIKSSGNRQMCLKSFSVTICVKTKGIQTISLWSDDLELAPGQQIVMWMRGNTCPGEIITPG